MGGRGDRCVHYLGGGISVGMFACGNYIDNLPNYTLYVHVIAAFKAAFKNQCYLKAYACQGIGFKVSYGPFHGSQDVALLLRGHGIFQVTVQGPDAE